MPWAIAYVWLTLFPIHAIRSVIQATRSSKEVRLKETPSRPTAQWCSMSEKSRPECRVRTPFFSDSLLQISICNQLHRVDWVFVVVEYCLVCLLRPFLANAHEDDIIWFIGRTLATDNRHLPWITEKIITHAETTKLILTIKTLFICFVTYRNYPAHPGLHL